MTVHVAGARGAGVERRKWIQKNLLRPFSGFLQLTFYVKRDSATDITITQMFITLAIMLEIY